MKYLKLMRIKHYLKNILIFLPLIFSETLFVRNNLIYALIAFVCFSLLASIVYIINDIKDIEKDRNHPVKKNRPIASGEISIKQALTLLVILFILIIIILGFNGLLLNVANLYLLLYLIINILYSLGLKDIPLIDVILLAFGYVIRVLYGGSIIGIKVSNWLFLTILSCSFYMAFGKRRNELIKLASNKVRKVLKYYNKSFLSINMYLFLVLTILFYSLWAIFGVDNGIFKYSIILVIIILIKYNMNLEDDSLGDPIEVIFNDKLLILIGIIYSLFCIFALYL